MFISYVPWHGCCNIITVFKLLFLWISRVGTSRKFLLQILSIYSNDNSKIVTLSPREFPHLVQNRENICMRKLWHIQYLYFNMYEVCLWVVQYRCNRFCVTCLQDFMLLIAFTIMRDMLQVGMLHCRYVFFIQEKLIYYFYFKMYKVCLLVVAWCM